MFGNQVKTEDTSAEAKGGRELKLAAVSATTAAAVIGRRIVVGSSLGVGGRPVFDSVPLPHGKVVAVGVGAPGSRAAVVMSNGDVMAYESGRWQMQYSLADAAEEA